MLATAATRTRPHRVPCTLGELMELYEANYSRLRLLLPELRHMSNEDVSLVPECLGLHLQVLERCKYTTTLRLHYAFSGHGEHERDPYLKIRIYHDARAAEAMTGLIHCGQGLDLTRSLQSRWQRNRFLFKWLGYCLHRGHRFQAAPAPA